MAIVLECRHHHLPELQACREAVVHNQEDHLRHVLQPSLPIALEEVAGNILQMPDGKSTKQLTRKLMHQVHHKSVGNAWRRRGAFPAALRYGWLRNLTRDDPDKPEGFSGQGARLRALPTTEATTIPDRAYRWGLQQRLGQDAPLTGQRCGKLLRGGTGPRCGAVMDAFGLHAARCARHTGLHRHKDVRDHLAQYARAAGVTATV